MPNITVTERTVAPKLDYGLLTGLIAGGVVSVWTLLIGTLGNGTAADFGAFKGALALGTDTLTGIGFNLNWLVGQIVHLAAFALIGVIFALVWPRIRTYGTWTPAVLFWLAAYIIDVQIIVRLISSEVASELTSVGVVIAYLLAGLVFAFRYRRA